MEILICLALFIDNLLAMSTLNHVLSTTPNEHHHRVEIGNNLNHSCYLVALIHKLHVFNVCTPSNLKSIDCGDLGREINLVYNF